MAESSGEKSQEPTPHRRQQAREEGNVAKSQDLAPAALLLAALGALWMNGASLVQFLAGYMRDQLGGEAWLHADRALATAQWNGVIAEVGRHLAPVLGAILVTVIVVNIAQVGFFFLPSKVGFDFSRVNPFPALQRMLAMDNVVRLAFGLFKLSLIVGIAVACLYHDFPKILGLSGATIAQIAGAIWHLVFATAMKIALALFVLAIIDYGYHFLRREQDLRMTPQEIREEMRNMEGDPQVAARRKAVHKQLAAQRLKQAVPKADAVVTNPTELAVAIQYNPEKMAAPIVVAKGAGFMAQQIRRLALEHGIPIVERKPLAQALYRDVEVDHPIPNDKYAAVAEVLAYVYHLKGKKINPPSAA